MAGGHLLRAAQLRGERGGLRAVRRARGLSLGLQLLHARRRRRRALQQTSALATGIFSACAVTSAG